MPTPPTPRPLPPSGVLILSYLVGPIGLGIAYLFWSEQILVKRSGGFLNLAPLLWGSAALLIATGIGLVLGIIALMMKIDRKRFILPAMAINLIPWLLALLLWLFFLTR